MVSEFLCADATRRTRGRNFLRWQETTGHISLAGKARRRSCSQSPGARLHPSIELETYNGALAGTVSRRRLLRSAAAGGGVAAAAAATFLFRRPRPVAGGFVGRGHVVGHQIRDGQPFPASPDRVRIPAVIVGGGIAGLSAAWWMRRLGFDEFVLLELEDSAGGNSRSGQNSITAYPWAAHYVPVPDRRIPLVEELFSELGVLQDGRWDPGHLSREPLSRLFADGAWSPGIEPGDAASRADHDQFDRFWDRMDYYRQGGEFTIPIRPPQQSTGLDRISMKSWMVAEGFFPRSAALVHRLLLQRRLRVFVRAGLGMGGNPLFRSSAGGRGRISHLARRQRVDRQSPHRAARSMAAHGAAGSADLEGGPAIGGHH